MPRARIISTLGRAPISASNNVCFCFRFRVRSLTVVGRVVVRVVAVVAGVEGDVKGDVKVFVFVFVLLRRK